LLGNINKLTDVFVGGWQLSGILRSTSGLPFSFYEPGYTTNWTYSSYAVVTGKVPMKRHFDANGNPQYFVDPNALNNGVATGTPIRLPYPGEAGERNYWAHSSSPGRSTTSPTPSASIPLPSDRS
jgi:hypothetical protein